MQTFMYIYSELKKYFSSYLVLSYKLHWILNKIRWMAIFNVFWNILSNKIVDVLLSHFC